MADEKLLSHLSTGMGAWGYKEIGSGPKQPLQPTAGQCVEGKTESPDTTSYPSSAHLTKLVGPHLNSNGAFRPL